MSYNIKTSLRSGWNVHFLYSHIHKTEAWVDHLYSHFIIVLSTTLLGGRKTTILVQFTSPNLFIYTPPFLSLFSFFLPTFTLLLVSNFVENSRGLHSITNLQLQLFVHHIVQVLLSLFQSHYYCDLTITSWSCG
jgi:hypothetical protein